MDSAFPVLHLLTDANGNVTTVDATPGISRRLFVAALMAQGLLAADTTAGRISPEDIKTMAYQHADALIAGE